MNKSLASSLALIAIASSPLGTIAQTVSQTHVEHHTETRTETRTVIYRNSLSALNSAKNYARQAAEERNGGLRVYRAEALMHGPVAQTRFVENSDGTVTFTFYGGTPAAKPTIESVVTVNLNSGKARIDYNGPIRSQVPGSSPSTTSSSQATSSQTTQTTQVKYRNAIATLNRAKNYARQAAEERNGGLRVYRAEALMHGPVAQTRFVENSDGTVTFTFYGGTPAAKPTIESVVTVNLNSGKARIDYNGPIRK